MKNKIDIDAEMKKLIDERSYLLFMAKQMVLNHQQEMRSELVAKANTCIEKMKELMSICPTCKTFHTNPDYNGYCSQTCFDN